ncbi:MAG: MBL fold metallo-hydrolase, partial [Gemmatimonadota bacterium]
MLLRQLHDPGLAQYAYLIGCPASGQALILDPERDVDRYLGIARSEGLELVTAAETHVHADFLSGTRELAARGCRAYVSGEGGEAWSYRWPDADHAEVVRLRDGDSLQVGRVELTAVHTPGHTPEHLCFLVTDRGRGADHPMGIASGDFVFVGSLGRPDLLDTATGRTDAMHPAAEDLHASLDRLDALEDWVQVWPGHGAGSACGKGLGAVPGSTLGYERRYNVGLEAARRGREAFVREMLSGQPDPPLYFARMKRLNRDGPPILGELPVPGRLTAAEVLSLADGGAQVLDARADRLAFMAAHVPGSLYASLERDFGAVAGSYLDPGRPVVLVADAEAVDAAVRSLVRVGIDRVTGWAPPEALEELGRRGSLASIRTASPSALGDLAASGAVIVDVRRSDEYRAGHVPGALLAPHVRLPEHLPRFPDDRPLAVHCRTGARAASAAAYLASTGRDAVYVDGAFANWA